MDTVILKIADNLNLVDPEIPDSEIRPDRTEQSDWQTKMKLKRRRFRPEPDGYAEVMFDGSAGNRDNFSGMGSDVSYDIGSTGEPAGW